MKVSTSLRLEEDLLEHARSVAGQDGISVAAVLERMLREDRMRRAVEHAAAIEQAEGHTSPAYLEQLAAEYAAVDGSIAAP
ncbi:hypothetical protein ACFXHA_28290 [Nocardia sp. NPDC059240]|uniref:hypothetical protein n=1 Tax=Nocardia sp. NPDC059240 TaxID=3346786 RepID=UPI0036B05213